ncbi:aldose 1-epimerase family protein [Ruminococcus sp. AF17-22AC]|uniref:aldose 1-epimerase family protein n=1 Tax=Ruminococcus sp. AF17-22AC TaxID=2292248 RepID=UPI00336C30C5
MLWNADPKYWKRHAPVLFPNVGRFYKDTCLIGGETYTSGQHGFARDMEFTCVEETETSVTHLLEATDATKKAWPYEFQLYITHTLNGRDLTVAWKVVNKDQEIMYFTIGAHPAFNVPVLPDTVQSQYHLTFSGQKELTYCLLHPEYATAMPDQPHTLSLENGTCLIDEHMFDEGALIFDDGQITKAGIVLPDGTPYVEISCEGFPNFGIWSAIGAPFVCLEPWMGRCDNTGYNEELSKKPNINTLKPTEIFDKSYVISVK